MRNATLSIHFTIFSFKIKYTQYFRRICRQSSCPSTAMCAVVLFVKRSVECGNNVGKHKNAFTHFRPIFETLKFGGFRFVGRKNISHYYLISSQTNSASISLCFLFLPFPRYFCTAELLSPNSLFIASVASQILEALSTFPHHFQFASRLTPHIHHHYIVC